MTGTADSRVLLSESEIFRRIDRCPKLGSLRSISSALSDLVNSENSYTSEIAEIIQKDPTLTARLLKLVNSVFFGLAHKVTNVEEAIFYLGMRQIKELALATPVIEDFSKLNKVSANADWETFWQHCIGSAMLTRELLAVAHVSISGDSDYISGLVHDVGKLVMAFVFPEQFNEVHSLGFSSPNDVCNYEREILGMDHSQIGAYYLEHHHLPEQVVEGVRYHNSPIDAPNCSKMCAAIQIADYMMRSVGVLGVESVHPIEPNSWENLEAWNVLFPEVNDEKSLGLASIQKSLQHMPSALKHMVAQKD